MTTKGRSVKIEAGAAPPKPSSAARGLRLSDPYRLALILLVLAYGVIFTGLAWDFHAGMRTHKADLGQIDQAVWNSSQGRFLQFTELETTSVRLTDHVEPIFVLISPLFWLWDDVRALLLLQVAAVAVGAFFVYALARIKLDQLLPPAQQAQIWIWEPLSQLTRPLALALAAAYLLAPPLQAAILTEVHAVPLGVPLILWAFWAVERRRWGQFILAALLVAAVKEEMALLAAGLGVWAVWRFWILDFGLGSGKRGRENTDQSRSPIQNPKSKIQNPQSLLPGLLVTVLALAWFYVATFVIVPRYAEPWYAVAESTYFQRYGALGDSPADIFKSFFTQPGLILEISLEPVRRDYVLGLLALFGFASLLAPEILLLCLPVLLANSLSAFPAQYYSQFHYDAPIVPFVTVSAVYGVARLWRWGARRLAASSPNFQHLPAGNPVQMALAAFVGNAGSSLRPLLALGLIVWILAWAGSAYAHSGRGPLGGGHDPTPVTAHHRLLPRFTAQIPPDAAVSATAAVHPHVSHRRHVYQFPAGLNAPANPATWALIDVTTNTDMAPGDLKSTVDALLAGEWGVVDAADGFLLLSRTAQAKAIPDAFYDFAREKAGENAQWTMDNAQWVDFGPVTAVGVEIEEWPRWRQTKVTTLWRVAADYAPGSVRPWLELRTPAGETIYTFDQIPPPALVWYPPERWQPGETLRITTLWLFLPRTWGAVAGAVHGPNPAEAAHRLPGEKPAGIGGMDATGSLGLIGAFHGGAGGSRQIFPAPAQAFWTPRQPIQVQLRAGAGDPIALRAGLAEPILRPGLPADIWLAWSDPLPPGYVPFVHLRRDGENVAQNDGPPRFFVAGPDLPVDWRQVTVPAAAPPGEWQIVVGLYNPADGSRAEILGADGQPAGSEVTIARPRLAPPLVPDQACAFIPATCGSQLP